PRFLLLFIPFFVLTFVGFEEVGRGYGRSSTIEQYNMARFAAFAWSTIGLVRRRLPFRVTNKADMSHGPSEARWGAPQILIGLLNNGVVIATAPARGRSCGQPDLGQRQHRHGVTGGAIHAAAQPLPPARVPFPAAA